MVTISLIGAGGKMGCRLTDNFIRTSYRVHYLEVSPKGLENLRQRGVSVSPKTEAVSQSEVIILAVPDVAIGAIAREVVPNNISWLPKAGRADHTWFTNHIAPYAP